MSIRMKFIVVTAFSFLGTAAFADNAAAADRPDRLPPSRQGTQTALSDDPVLSSFQRMLSHEPNRIAPPVPAHFEADPLIEALALPVLRWLARAREQTVSAHQDR
jgi:hypothetical protein